MRIGLLTPKEDMQCIICNNHGIFLTGYRNTLGFKCGKCKHEWIVSETISKIYNVYSRIWQYNSNTNTTTVWLDGGYNATLSGFVSLSRILELKSFM